MAEDAKESILRAAAEEFSDKGKAGARMQAIADKAGVNKAMLNYYFTSKDQLFYAVVRTMLKDAKEATVAELEGIDNAKEFIRKFVLVQQKNLLRNPEWIRLVIQNYLVGDQETVQIIQDDSLFAFFIEKLERFVANGEIRIKKTANLLMLIMGLNLVTIMAQTDFQCLLNKDGGNDLNFEDFLKSHYEVITDVLENGMFND